MYTIPPPGILADKTHHILPKGVLERYMHE